MGAGELKLDKKVFLARHWQREPLLIRNAIKALSPPLSADELAGLAMEDDVESRIIEAIGERWLLQHGPFNEQDFERDNPWTLLVQAVDHHIPEVAELRRLFDFLPQWRVDDVMVSYAVDGGSVGPHYDNYDVFLIQGEGKRHWQLGQFCEAGSPLLDHEDLRILRDFHCSREYVLGPGDVLYLPPGVAHWGIARGECTTFSIGFRAPRLSDMVSRWADRLLEQMDQELFFSDSHLEAVTRAGEIRPRDLARAMTQLQGALDQEIDNHWFGELVTEPRYKPGGDDDDLAEARAVLADSPAFVALSAAAKLAWQQEKTGIVVFANGESRIFADTVLPSLITLCESWRLEGAALDRALGQVDTAGLLDHLLETGSIYVE
jgi:50S ribosomal protein L16 3-hydroxylase